MSHLRSPTDVFLFASLLYNKNDIDSQTSITLLSEHIKDDIFFRSSVCPMKDYYSNEMGSVDRLDRFFIVSTSLQKRDSLVPLKLWATEQEELKFNRQGKRFLNIDIGVISLENVQLATGKNFTHRIYLRDNIFSDLTLIYRDDSYSPLPWTYADYASRDVILFFNWVRELLKNKLT